MDSETIFAENFVFASYMRARRLLDGRDEVTRHPELTARVLEALGSPQVGLPCLLVAGSKGKGSTAAFAARLLGAAGGPVGLFSSPHLLDVRERIRVDGVAIPAERFSAQVRRLATIVEPLERQLGAQEYFSPVGLLLCVALLHFREAGVRVAVVEAGRGARFDDTRLVDHPVAAITPIMGEHRRELGSTLARISWHKAGAIPWHGVAVSAPQRPAARAVIEAEADARHSRLILVGRDVHVNLGAGDEIDIRTPGRTYLSLRPGLRGAHQAENLAVALAAAEAFQPETADLRLDTIREAVRSTYWPGRCELLQTRPVVLVDGAINAASARAFIAAALSVSPPPRFAIAAAPADKDYRGLLRTLAPHVGRLYVTRASNPYLEFPTAAEIEAFTDVTGVVQRPSLREAAAEALQELGENGSLWIVGTQSLVADALRLWGRSLESLTAATIPC